MKKYLITGISGFVSHHFLQYLERKKIDCVVKGLDIKDHGLPRGSFKHIEYSFENVQLLDAHKTGQMVAQFRPDYILHLASYSSVASSWKYPILSFQNNTNIFLNLLEAARELSQPTRILSVGSSEEYGKVEKKDQG